MTSASRHFLAGSGLILIGVVGFAVDARPLSFMFALAATLFGYVWALRHAAGASRKAVILALVLLRFVALPLSPTLSDDWYRYAHEARASRVDLASVYAVAPRDMIPPPPPDDGISGRVNHPEIKAAYPPLSQLSMMVVFALGDAMGMPLAVYKLFLLLLDGLCLAVCFVRRGRMAALLYGLCPLVLIEVHFNAHVDMCAVTLLFLAFAARRSARPGLAVGALVAAASGFKPIAPLALATLRRRHWLAAAPAFAIVFVAPYALYLALGAPVFSGFVEYATRWEANATVYKIAEAPFADTFRRRAEAGRWANLHVNARGLHVEENGATLWAIGDPVKAPRPVLLDARFFARLLVAAIFALLALLIWRTKRPNERPGYLLAGAYLCAPTLHPWYLLWALPSAALTQDRALTMCIALAPALYASRFGLDVNLGWLVLAAYLVALLKPRSRPMRDEAKTPPGKSSATKAQ